MPYDPHPGISFPPHPPAEPVPPSPAANWDIITCEIVFGSPDLPRPFDLELEKETCFWRVRDELVVPEVQVGMGMKHRGLDVEAAFGWGRWETGVWFRLELERVGTKNEYTAKKTALLNLFREKNARLTSESLFVKVGDAQFRRKTDAEMAKDLLGKDAQASPPPRPTTMTSNVKSDRRDFGKGALGGRTQSDAVQRRRTWDYRNLLAETSPLRERVSQRRTVPPTIDGHINPGTSDLGPRPLPLAPQTDEGPNETKLLATIRAETRPAEAHLPSRTTQDSRGRSVVDAERPTGPTLGSDAPARTGKHEDARQYDFQAKIATVARLLYDFACIVAWNLWVLLVVLVVTIYADLHLWLVPPRNLLIWSTVSLAAFTFLRLFLFSNWCLTARGGLSIGIWYIGLWNSGSLRRVPSRLATTWVVIAMVLFTTLDGGVGALLKQITTGFFNNLPMFPKPPVLADLRPGILERMELLSEYTDVASFWEFQSKCSYEFDESLLTTIQLLWPEAEDDSIPLDLQDPSEQLQVKLYEPVGRSSLQSRSKDRDLHERLTREASENICCAFQRHPGKIVLVVPSNVLLTSIAVVVRSNINTSKGHLGIQASSFSGDLRRATPGITSKQNHTTSWSLSDERWKSLKLRSTEWWPEQFRGAFFFGLQAPVGRKASQGTIVFLRLRNRAGNGATIGNHSFFVHVQEVTAFGYVVRG